MMTGAEPIPTTNLTIWATPFGPGGRRTGGGSTSSTSVLASATRQLRQSERKFVAGNLDVASTSGLTILRGCSTPSSGVGLRTTVVTTSRRFTQRYAIWTDV